MNFDGLLYILGIPMMVMSFLLIAVNTAMFLMGGMSTFVLIFNYVKYLAATLVVPILTAVFTLVVDKRPIRPMLKGILAYPLFMGSWLVINVKCMIKPNTTWEKINHGKNIKIEDVTK